VARAAVAALLAKSDKCVEFKGQSRRCGGGGHFQRNFGLLTASGDDEFRLTVSLATNRRFLNLPQIGIRESQRGRAGQVLLAAVRIMANHHDLSRCALTSQLERRREHFEPRRLAYLNRFQRRSVGQCRAH
jgi:hypothetical protein